MNAARTNFWLECGGRASASVLKDCLTSQATELLFACMDLPLLGKQLREARTALGWSLREAETHTKVSNAYLSQLEGAKIKAPSPNVLHSLSEVYELSYAMLMEYAGYPVPAEAQITGTEQRFMSRLGRTSQSEQQALLEYLRFLRTRKR
jgi:transcriptional regulator with XRE-family HTH domain